jgi:Zn-dependent protease/CBS domain-containing protein
MRLGTLLGFEVRLDPSWFIIFFIVATSGVSAQYGLAMGVLGALLLFGSVLLHEVGHSVVGRRLGMTIEGITLFIFGGVARLKEEPRSPGVEFLMTAAGPLVSAVLAVAFFMAAGGTAVMEAPRAITSALNYAAVMNASLAVFNLIPAFPLDGGRLFRSTVWGLTRNEVKATRWAAFLSKWFAYLLGAAGVVEILRGDWSGLWLVFIAMFVRRAGRDAYRNVVMRAELEAVPLASLVGESPTYIPSGTSLAMAADYLQAAGADAALVHDADEVRGIVTMDDIAAVAENQRPWTSAAEVCQPIGAAGRIEMDQNAWQALTRMVSEGRHRFLVMADGRVRGILTIEQLARRIPAGA